MRARLGTALASVRTALGDVALKVIATGAALLAVIAAVYAGLVLKLAPFLGKAVLYIATPACSLAAVLALMGAAALWSRRRVALWLLAAAACAALIAAATGGGSILYWAQGGLKQPWALLGPLAVALANSLLALLLSYLVRDEGAVAAARSARLPGMDLARAPLVTRRRLLAGTAALGAGTMSGGGYALAEPFRLNVTRYQITPPGWPEGLAVRLAVIADLHACAPWMGPERIAEIVQRANGVEADAVLLLGDYVVGDRLARNGEAVPHSVWARTLSGLNAPLGVHAVLGNHDWWEDLGVQQRRAGPVKAQLALEAVGIPVYENRAVRLEKDGFTFWLAGLADQWAFWPRREDIEEFQRNGGAEYVGLHDVAATLAQVTDASPVILMAHEPDIFAELPARVSLTISGHTHGGQIRIGNYAPVVPSRYGRRYLYGHIVEEGRHLVVSGGLGCSGVPVRFGSPPEIVVIELGAGRNVA